MVEIKHVAIVGAAGSLGTPVSKAIIESGKFNVTILTREGSTSTFPSSVKVIKVDFSSVDSLTRALEGQDAVVSTVGTPGLLGQSILIDAAIAAGVKRFIPSEFGCDLSNAEIAALPVFGYKIATRKHLEQKVAAGANITYTYIESGPFLDWCLERGLFLSWDGKPKIWDGGNNLVSVTTLASVGLATVGVLTHYEETKNKSVFVEEAQISQNQLLAMVKKLAPQKIQEPISASTAELKKSLDEAVAKGDYSPGVMMQYLLPAIFGGQRYGSAFIKNDNELLGVPQKTEQEIEAIVKKTVA